MDATTAIKQQLGELLFFNIVLNAELQQAQQRLAQSATELAQLKAVRPAAPAPEPAS